METLWSRSEAATRGDGGVGGSADGGAGALPLPLLAAVEARADGAAGNAPSDDAAAPEEPAVGAAPRGDGGVGGSAGGAGAWPLPLLAAVEARADGAAGISPDDDAANAAAP